MATTIQCSTNISIADSQIAPGSRARAACGGAGGASADSNPPCRTIGWMATAATPAVHFLRKHGVSFTEHPYDYEAHGGTRVSARELGVPEHQVIKTLVMEDERKQPLLVLMHGDREVSTKN